MSNKTYTDVWRKYLPIIKIYLKKDLREPQSFNVNSVEFNVGNRPSGYDFRIIIDNARHINSKSGSVVGDNLAELLVDSMDFRESLSKRKVIISMKDFKVTLKEE